MKLATPCRPARYGLWLDDLHSPPSADWEWVKTPHACCQAMLAYNFSIVSLDHDLGMPSPQDGMAVLTWLEELRNTPGEPDIRPHELRIHSANVVAAGRMSAVALALGYIEGKPLMWQMASSLRTVRRFLLRE